MWILLFFFLLFAIGYRNKNRFHCVSLRILYLSTAPIPSLSSNSQIHPFRQLTNAQHYTLQWLHCLIYSVPLCEIRYLSVFTYECTFTWLTGYTVQYSVAGLHHSNCLTSVTRVFVSFTVWWCHWIPTMSTKEFRSHLQGKTAKACLGKKTTTSVDVGSTSIAAPLPGSLQHSSHSVVTSEEWTGNSWHQMHFSCRLM